MISQHHLFLPHNVYKSYTAIRLKTFSISSSHTWLEHQAYKHTFGQASSSEATSHPNKGGRHKFDVLIPFGVSTA